MIPSSRAKSNPLPEPADHPTTDDIRDARRHGWWNWVTCEERDEADAEAQDDDDDERSEGFWREFFLLRPDRPALRKLLDGMGPADMLAMEERTRELFARAVAAVKSGQGVADLHALGVSASSNRCRVCFVPNCD